jgi:hypothetical protein
MRSCTSRVYSHNHAVILLPCVAGTGNAVKFLPCHADIIGKIFLNGAKFSPLQHPPHIHRHCPFAILVLPAGRTHVSEKQTRTGGEANKLIPPRVTRQYFAYLYYVIEEAEEPANVKILQPLVLTLHERKILEVNPFLHIPKAIPTAPNLSSHSMAIAMMSRPPRSPLWPLPLKPTNVITSLSNLEPQAQNPQTIKR